MKVAVYDVWAAIFI